MEGFPAGISSWSVMRIFLEGYRLLNEHFGVCLPAILLFIFPASLIKVLYMQFLFALQFHSPDSEPTSFWTQFFLDIVSGLPQIFLVFGASVLFHVLTNAVYIADGKAIPSRTELLRDWMKLTLFRRDVEAENPVLGTTTTEHPLYDLFCETSKGKKLKACAVVVGSAMLYIVGSTQGLNFTPESVAEWGLPPATIFLFTALVTLLSTATTTYLILVNLVLLFWIFSLPSLGFITRVREIVRVLRGLPLDETIRQRTMAINAQLAKEQAAVQFVDQIGDQVKAQLEDEWNKKAETLMTTVVTTQEKFRVALSAVPQDSTSGTQ